MCAAPRLIRCDATAPQPWRNGGGVTRELLAWPSAQAWQVRISVADIERDGPFSPFPGVQRWFAVLDGEGVELDWGGLAPTRHLRGDAPLCFDGAAAPACSLRHGATRDLNLMLRGACGGLALAHSGVPWRPAASAAGLFTRVAGACALADGSGAIELPAFSLLWFDAAPQRLVFRAAGGGAAARVAAGAAWWLAATPLAGEVAS